MALTNKGYKRETYTEILARLENKAKELFGENTNTSQRSALGMILRVMAWALSLVHQDVEQVYYSAYRHTAEGKQLDYLLPYAGITRNPATAAYGMVTFTGTPGERIPLGTTVTKGDVLYQTIEEKWIAPNGAVDIEVMCEELGTIGNADIGEINQLLNPMQHVMNVRNPIAITNGRERESDVDARKRADEAQEGIGWSTVSAIRSKLRDNPDIRAVYIDNNATNHTNEYGTPMRAFQCFVLGGQDEDIAQAIMDKKAAGVQAYGTTTLELLDDAGEPQLISFTRAEIIQVYARLTLRTNIDFPTDGQRQVKDALVRYVGGIDTESTVHAGLAMGENVVITKLIAAVYQVEGVDDVDIELSTNNKTFAPKNLEMRKSQIAQLSANSIEVV